MERATTRDATIRISRGRTALIFSLMMQKGARIGILAPFFFIKEVIISVLELKMSGAMWQQQ